MKVLIITLNAWSDTGSTGNTISNVFGDATDIQFANLYCRNEPINNNLCHTYYKITEDQIIKSLIGKKAGKSFELADSHQKTDIAFNPLSNGGLGNFLRKYRPTFLLFLRELVWLLPVWKNKGLRAWLKAYNPDIVYMHGHTNIYMHRIMEYCARVTGAKIVMFFGDDMYGRKTHSPVGYLYESLYRRRLRRSIAISSLLFGGSTKLCEEYSKLFHKEFHPMFKQCDLSGLQGKTTINNPITIVYAGNLLFGREDVICSLIEVLKKVNNLDLIYKLKLLIYSNTIPGSSSLKILNDGVNSVYMGCKPYSIICECMNKSDMSLFLESFNKENIKKTRLSFSTKIIDCMQSDSAMLAICPAQIASMDYVIKNSIGITATSMDEAYQVLKNICEHPQAILSSIDIKTAFATQHHTNKSKEYMNQIKAII